MPVQQFLPANPAGGPPIALLGIPLELGAADRGAIMGPAALRTAGLAAHLTEMGFAVHDHGDLAAPVTVASGLDREVAATCNHADEIGAWVRAIHDRAHGLLANGNLPIFMGGDHSLSMGTISAAARHCQETGKRLAVLWLDAHADFNNPATTPSGNMHGMPLSFLTGEASLQPLLGGRPFPLLRPADTYLMGLRSIDSAERQALAESGINSFDMRMIDEFGVAVLVKRVLRELEGRNVHLHVSLDLDFLDPSIAPGVGTAAPGGATYREAHLILEMVHESGLVGSLDLVELNPFLDERGKSARVMVELTTSLFGRTVLDRPSARPRSIAPRAAQAETRRWA